MKYFVIAYVAFVILTSVVAFLLYGFDKRRARNDGRRIPEKTLQLLALLGGWPGALMGQQYFRHKTRKLSFQLIYWLCVLTHVGIVATLFYLFVIRS